jgi:DNA helicase-2/ATP-dependent DNA helicase PcrA
MGVPSPISKGNITRSARPERSPFDTPICPCYDRLDSIRMPCASFYVPVCSTNGALPPMDLMQGLDPAQAQAVRAAEAPILVLAGPGSGKTRVLTHRIAYLIGELGVRPYQILAVTFTNKAAREMISRLEEMIGTDTRQLTIGTFHAACVRILRREASYLGMGANFVIFDDDDQIRLITRILKDLNLDKAVYRPRAVQNVISQAKNDFITVDEYRPPTYWHEAIGRVFERYEALKAESNALDFDDLLLKTAELLHHHPEVLERYQQRYRHVLVDEFQDTNRAQYEIIRRLAESHRHVFVVGDEDQSIYSWRGADFRNVLRFRSDFPDAQVYLLEQNYRSTQTILDAAQAIISRNNHRVAKNLWTENERGTRIRVVEAYDEREEAGYVADEIQRLAAREGEPLGEFAVMYRTNAQSRAVEEAFNQRRLRYRLVGGTRFYNRREIKDVLAYLRVIYNPDDEVSLRRIINVPARGIGSGTMDRLAAWSARLGLSMGGALLHLVRNGDGRGEEAPFTGRARRALYDFGVMLDEFTHLQQEQTLSELLEKLLDRTDYVIFLRDGTEEGEERINNVRELFSVTGGYTDTPAAVALPLFLEQASLVSDVDEADWQSDSVTMLTLHAAKGLEFDNVFIIGMEEGICPHTRSMDDLDQMEEERRLCYVGITRARKRLYLVRAFRRTLFGSSEVRDPSRFLAELPQHLVDGVGASRVVAPPTASRSSAPMGRQERRDLISRRREAVRRAAERARLSDAPPAQRSRRPATAPSLSRPSRPGSRGHLPIDAQEPEARTTPRVYETTFGPGESVRHAIFGTGIVVSSRIVDGDEEVTVAFEGRGIKKLIASYAKLERVG